MDRRVVAVSVSNRVAFLDDDTPIAITNFIDAFGDETNNPREAAFIVAKESEHRWHTVDMGQFENVRPN